MATELEGLIVYWKTKLQYDRFLMPPEGIYFVEQTIKNLEELKNIKES